MAETFHAKVVRSPAGTRLVFDNGTQWKVALSDRVGERVTLTIDKFKDRRSVRANAYYWGVVLKLIAEHSGHTPQDLHDALSEKFAPGEQKQMEFVNTFTGEIEELTTDSRRTSKLSMHDFYEYVEHVRVWASEWMGVETPDPDPDYWRKRLRVTP